MYIDREFYDSCQSFSSYIEGFHYKRAQITQLFHIFTGHDPDTFFAIFIAVKMFI